MTVPPWTVPMMFASSAAMSSTSTTSDVEAAPGARSGLGSGRPSRGELSGRTGQCRGGQQRGAAHQVQDVVGHVEREDVGVLALDEETGDPEDHVYGPDDRRHRANGRGAGVEGGDQRDADGQVHEVVQRIDLEDAEKL